jgi:hypothetical protein
MWQRMRVMIDTSIGLSESSAKGAGEHDITSITGAVQSAGLCVSVLLVPLRMLRAVQPRVCGSIPLSYL